MAGPTAVPPDDPNKKAFLHIATPSGKAGYVPLDRSMEGELAIEATGVAIDPYRT
jgi:hypothetical protein